MFAKYFSQTERVGFPYKCARRCSCPIAWSSCHCCCSFWTSHYRQRQQRQVGVCAISYKHRWKGRSLRGSPWLPMIFCTICFEQFGSLTIPTTSNNIYCKNLNLRKSEVWGSSWRFPMASLLFVQWSSRKSGIWDNPRTSRATRQIVQAKIVQAELLSARVVQARFV